MNWRIYRLPGSREVWHVDNGPGTQIVNVYGFEIYGPSKSVDIVEGVPRAWIEIPHGVMELHVIKGKAIWRLVAVSAAVADVAEADASAGNAPGLVFPVE